MPANHPRNKFFSWYIADVAIGMRLQLRSSGNYTHSVAGLCGQHVAPTKSISLQKD